MEIEKIINKIWVDMRLNYKNDTIMLYTKGFLNGLNYGKKITKKEVEKGISLMFDKFRER